MLSKALTKYHIQTLTLFLILIIGASLRFYGLETQSLWNDELSSWRRSSFDNLSTVINKGVLSEVWPPGYHVLLYLVEQYVGDSETILRFPSAISGILSIAVIFAMGRHLYSYREGLIAAILMAVLRSPIYFSQEARAYVILMLFTLSTTYFWIIILESFNGESRTPYHAILGYITTAIITSYLHYFGVFFIALEGLGAILFFFHKRRVLFHIFLIYAFILLAYLPWIPLMIYQITSNRGAVSWIQNPGPTAFFSYLKFLFNQSNWLVLLSSTLYAFLFLYNFYRVQQSRTYKNIKTLLLSPTFLLVLWLIIPFVITYLVSIIWVPILVNRYLIISLPAAYLLMARAITQLPINRGGQTIVTFLIMGLFLYHLLFHSSYYSKPHKAQFREAVGFVAERADLYKNSLIIGYVWYPDYLDYYFKKKGSDQKVDMIAGQKEDIPTVIENIQIKKADYVWYISAHKIPSPEFIAFLNQNFTMINHEAFIEANVWLFENPE